jgi:hypothetical protein
VACPRQLNIRIGKRAPSDYMNEIRQDKNTQLASCFDSHRIPVDMLSDRTWDGLFRTFIEERAKKIFALIERYVIEPLAEMEAAHGVPSGIVDDDEKRSNDLDRLPNMIADGRVQIGERVYVCTCAASPSGARPASARRNAGRRPPGACAARALGATVANCSAKGIRSDAPDPSSVPTVSGIPSTASLALVAGRVAVRLAPVGVGAVAGSEQDRARAAVVIDVQTPPATLVPWA